METFTPINHLETRLRAMLTDTHTPSWSFYTPLAAVPLWFIVRHYPELDGSDLVAPAGQTPDICLFTSPGKETVIGIYTAECRVEKAFQIFQISPHQMCWVSAPGFQLLRYLSTMDASLWINAGLSECQYHLDPDMVEILLSRPEPAYPEVASRQVILPPDDSPNRFLRPLEEFLTRHPTVRAAWIFAQEMKATSPLGSKAYELGLLMTDPEDESLLEEVTLMAKALTPVGMEWTASLLMADDKSLRNLAREQPPFYKAPNFLK